MNKIKIYTILSTIIIGFMFTGCDDTYSAEQIDSIVIPSRNVSYSEYIQPVFNFKCTNSGCHDSMTQAGGVNLTSWTNTTADPSVVFPFQPNNSRLVWAIEGQTGSIMPPFSAYPLTDNQREGIITWISEGAQSN